jgi:hypothetical protein
MKEASTSGVSSFPWLSTSRLMISGYTSKIILFSSATKITSTAPFVYRFPFTLTLTDGGTQTLYAQMAKADGTKFGQQVTITVKGVGDYAKYVSDTIPTTITHDNSYSVKVIFRNTGTNIWTAAAGYKLKYSNTYFPVTGSVASGGTASFSFTIKIHTPGTYNVPIQMSRNGVVFGELKTKTIKVI